MEKQVDTSRCCGILGRLRRDRGGNTLAIMAAAMVPMIGFAGSAVDMSRLYVVKVRLQQACDAGVLAGRKSMTDTAMSTPLETAATGQAQAFFANNFRQGWFQTASVAFTPTKASVNTDPNVANAVAGTASATVPMAVMSFFSVAPQTINVKCQAVFDIADADVMFVLDTTGSMTCYPQDSATCNNGTEKPAYTANGTTTYSKLESLRQSVLLFDTTIRASADPNTKLRYGFVTYTSAVNVGGVIPTQYLQTPNWTYQSRHLSPVAGPNGWLAGEYQTSAQNVSRANVSQSACKAARTPTGGFSKTGSTWYTNWNTGNVQARRYYNVTWSNSNGGTCAGVEQVLRPYWRLEPVEWNISQFIGTLSGGSVIDPTRLDGTTTSWKGCIEELDTSPATSFNVNNLPDDLNPDVIPTASSNSWRPMWPDVTWRRGNASPLDIADENYDEYSYNYKDGLYLGSLGYAACGMPARRLDVMSTQKVRDYLYDPQFKAFGGTYHDTGMIWGTRMIAPAGVFAQDTAAWQGRQAPSRSIVFMTDGQLAPNGLIYGQYGLEDYDNRTGSANDDARDLTAHAARFRVECDAAKKRGITIYVVALGTGVTSDLSYCASPGQAFQASSTDQLKSAFKTIAQRVATLRISQ